MLKRLKNYFIPHQGNDYKPDSLQKTAVIMMGVLVMLSFTFANLQALLWINSSWLVSTVLPAVVVELTNESRDGQSLNGLTRNATLDEAARLKAEHMAQYEYFSHYAPDGTSPWYWFDQVEYGYIHAGENLAVHFTDSDEVVDAWMDSPTHRANILNGNYTEIGVGTAKGEYQGYPTVFVVQLFGAPAPQIGTLALETPTPEETLAQAEVEPAPALLEEPVPNPEPVEELVPEPSVRDAVPVAEPVLEPTEIAVELTSNNEPILLVSETIETSQEAVAGIESAQTVPFGDNPVSTIGRIATQPHTLLNLVYMVTALFVLGALITSIFIEIRKQHPVQIAYGTGLLAMMAVLTYVHLAVSSGVLIA